MATISVGDLTPRNQYTATSGQTAFTYSFPIFEDGDLKVYIGETLQTLTTDYTVSGAGTDNGGTVTLTTGATLNDIVTIYRDLPVERTTDFQANGDLLAETLNDELDALTMMVQQIEYDLNSRCLRFGQFTTGIPLSEFTENAADRANKVLAFDSSGDPNITQELGTYQGTDATTTTANYVIRDIVKDSSNNNIYICIADSTSGTLLTNTSYWALIVDAESAATSASAAATSATAAATSATAAQTAQTAAETAETNAETAETNAETAQTAAETAQTAAETAQTAAETAQAAAETAETNAETSETNAATSESNASTSETNAATSATNAANSATSASSSATTATTKASEASTSASNASTSETNASNSASAAATSATNAATSATNAQAALDSIENFYLGASATAPTVDDNGDPLAAGDWYFNTTDNKTYIYNGSSFQVTVEDTSGLVSTSGDTMTGDLIISTTGALTLPVGTEAQRPTAVKGMFRFNDDEDQFEGYDGTEWGAVGGGNTAVVGWENQVTVAENYTITTDYNMMSAGPITIDSGYSVTVPSGSVWTIV